MKVPFLDLSIKDENKRKKLISAVNKVFLHGRIVMGPEVDELEREVSQLCGVKYAVGVGSGSDALYMALRSLDIKEGDEVITTCLSWIATANAISLVGAKPVFADIRQDFNIDPDKIECLITSKTKAIVVVHFTGKMCEMDIIEKISKKHHLFLIEDAAQAFGASYKGKMAGAFGDVSAFSMNPMKVLGACGETGMVLTEDRDIYNKLVSLRYSGTVDRIEAHYTSLNFRIDTIQAAILLERLKNFDEDISKRRNFAKYYNEHLLDIVTVPKENINCFDVFYTYNIICEKRDELKSFLNEKGIETKIHHSLLMPEHAVYKKSYSEKWDIGGIVTKKSLCLPMHEKLTKHEQDYVIENIKEFYKC